MGNEYKPDLITLIDDENVEHNFDILDTIENEKGVFYALYPIFDSAEESVEDSGEYYIMEVIEVDGEEQLAEVEDEALLDELSAIFEQHFEEMFDDIQEDCASYSYFQKINDICVHVPLDEGSYRQTAYTNVVYY